VHRGLVLTLLKRLLVFKKERPPREEETGECNDGVSTEWYLNTSTPPPPVPASTPTKSFSHIPMAPGIPRNIKKEQIISTLAAIDREGYPKEHESIRYSLVYEGRRYPPVWVILTANNFSNEYPPDAGLFSDGEQSNNFLKKFGFRIAKKTHSAVDHTSFDFETMERERTWREIQAHYKGQNIPAHVLRDTYRISSGSAGIWVDRERTLKISNDESGIAISVFYNGTKYLSINSL
jgi:hypothetical protein